MPGKVIIQKLVEEEFKISEHNIEPVSLINYRKIKPIVYDQLFSAPQPISNIRVYKFKDKEGFIIKGKAILCQVNFK